MYFLLCVLNSLDLSKDSFAMVLLHISLCLKFVFLMFFTYTEFGVFKTPKTVRSFWMFVFISENGF